jgi:hypothetical protein
MDAANILDKIIKPGDCILAFGVPTLKDDFYNDLESENKDFAKTIASGWPQYKTTIIKVIHKVEPVMKELGVNIIPWFNSKRFWQAL